ncbi:phage/plasmid primase, P4 family [Acinetobacter baumannii]|uniref:phage/plasmid primase, P4 family n=1 Tax=Acinetobacter baumannii TaxID=470 RepID=UPI0011274565|nr:phage/plasmid primase, P4 family [Acinetobacter baumannii]TPS34475.1 hypothetical protein FJU48_16875 [Acinetobacter baumannii]
MIDSISILKHSAIPLAKTWRIDGSVTAYQDAKYFSLIEKPISNLKDLSGVLHELEGDSKACVIRGMYKGDDYARQVDSEFKQGNVRRQKRLFEDKPHHWVLIEIDDFKPLLADPILEPVEAINEYITSCLPDCFHEISYHWQLSNSAGHLKNIDKLKAHVWFWLEKSYTSDQLKAWAEQNNIALDKSVFNTVQIHYTASPIFERGIDDPVPVRSGFVEGLFGDVVSLEILLKSVSTELFKVTTVDDAINDPFAGIEPKVGLTLSDAISLIRFIDSNDYQTWLKAGMALHHEFDGSSDALALWDEWSQGSCKYEGYDVCQEKWSTFGNNGHNPVTARWLLKYGGEATKNAENQEKHRAMDEMKRLILDCNDSVVLINDIAKKAGLTAVGDIAMRTELTGLIRAQFKRITKTSLPLPDARMAMNSAVPSKTKGVDGRHEMTELGNVGRMIDRYGDDLIFIPQTETWYSWNGFYWQPITAVEITQYATATIKALPDELKDIPDDDTRSKHRKFYIDSQKIKMAEAMVKWARSDERLLRNIKTLDANANLLGCANGVIDLTTGILLTPDREYMISYSTGIEYSLSARCPVFEQTVLDAFFGDAEMVTFFQRVIGYIALGQPKESIILIPYGSGNNGKSTIFKSIALALGDYAKTANADTFLGDSRSNSGGAREDILRLRGSRFVYSTEPDEGKELKEGLIKAMTGGEALPARGLYARHTVEVQPTWTVVMPTNHKPIIKGDDYGIWRRIMLVPFTRNYDDDPTIKKDVNRPAKLLRELPGILRWIVLGALKYLQEGLNPPKGVVQAKEEYRDEMDLLRDWMSSCCLLGTDIQTTSEDLFQSWKGYAERNGVLRLIPSKNHLSRKLEPKFKKKNIGERKLKGFVGIGLRSDFEGVADV